MWLMTQYGFYSIVQHRDETDRYMVRARVRHDLENLRELAGLDAEILEGTGTDYPFRLIVSGAEVLQVLDCLGRTINYGNFKDRIHELPDQENKGRAYLDVWSTMRRVAEPQRQDDAGLRPRRA